MAEYAALLQINFTGLLSDGLHGFIDWIAAVPIYWHVAALIIFFILVRILSRRKT